MELQDRVFIALLSTLFLAVILVEWRNRWRGVPAHVKPVSGGDRLLDRCNVPDYRDCCAMVTDVADFPQPTVSSKNEFGGITDP